MDEDVKCVKCRWGEVCVLPESSGVHTGSVFLGGRAVAERKAFDAPFALSCCARAE